MIKRYTMGRVALGNTGNGTLTGAGIVENTAGEFVRYEDVAHLLEEKTIEQHRVEFEEWVLNTKGSTLFKKNQTGEYKRSYITDLWEAWKTARGVTE